MVRAHAPLLILAAGLLVGCGGGRFTVQNGGALARDYAPTDRMRVMLAAAGPAGEAGARAVSARIIAVLLQTHGDVALIPTSNEADALADARQANATFLISPTILEWHDGHAPPLTADRIKVRLDLRDPSTGEVVNTVTYENVSSLVAAVDTTPDALLDGSFDRAVMALITSGSKPPA